MTGRKKANKHEAGWPADTVALAHAARPQLFNSLHSLKATEVKSADTERYERLFAQAEALLDGTQSHKLLSTAQEHLLRAGEPHDSAQAARAVARTYAHQLLIALVHHHWKAS
jgi:hypothetical protein